jgi:hypothetical protein
VIRVAQSPADSVTTTPLNTVASFSALEAAILKVAEDAAREHIPGIQQKIIDEVKGVIHTKLGGVLPPEPDAPTITPDVITQAAARSRALRTLLYGLFISAFWGVLSAFGSVNGIDFFTKTGLISTLTILGSAAVTSVVSYIGRIKWSPSPVVANSPTAD